MSIKKRSLDERVDYVTTQLELLLQKEIERNKELDKERAERKEREAALEAERDKERAEREKDRAERKERDAALGARIDQFTSSLEQSFAKLNKIVSDYGLSSGEEAEFTFQLAIENQDLTCGSIHFDEMLSNVKKSREYDIILTNGKYVALIEVKRKASLRAVTKLVKEQAVSFRSDFPEYADKTLVCFLAAYVAVDTVIAKAKSLGVGVLLQDGYDIKEEISTLTNF